MSKRVLSALLALCLLCTLAVVPAAAADSSGVEETIKALGIMTGDENGNMNLNNNVTRAEFAKMLTAASVYHDTIGTNGAGYSLFSDVKSSHWASEYIKLAVEQGWMMGYTDGSFRPEQTITLEEACTTILRLLGYDSSTLAGSYPTAQLNKASALGLRDQITLSQGQTITRRDCMYLFYNALTAQTSDGKVYATTIGYSVTNGQVDYASVVSQSVSGPYVYDGTAPQLTFTPVNVYRDGTASTMASLTNYDVYYYNASLRTVWIYTDRVSGTVSALSPNATAPTSVTLGSVSYTLGTPTATYKLSTMGGCSVGDTVMLLLGMDGTVVDVVTGTDINSTFYGVVQSSTKLTSSSGNAAVQTQVDVACTDGSVHSFTVTNGATYSAGSLVTVSVSSGGTTIRNLSIKSTSGAVNANATRLGDLTFADNIQILDVNSSGGYARIYPSRLAGCTLGTNDVRFYALDERGQISHLILNDVTGDLWNYAYMISASTVQGGTDSMKLTGNYTYIMNGVTKTLVTNGITFPVQAGGVALLFDTDGSFKSTRNLTSVTIDSLGVQSAMSNNRKYVVSGDAQVYLRQGSSYYATTLSSVDPDNYKLTGWYDSFSSSAGGQIRIIIAVER